MPEERTSIDREPILKIKGIHKYYDLKTLTLFGRIVEKVKAVRGVSLDLFQGEVLGLVGESGCGKSTLSRLIVRLETPDRGEIQFKGQNIFSLNNRELKRLRKGVQLVFQNPFTSLSPKMTIGEQMRDPLIIHKIIKDKKKDELKKETIKLLEMVGLEPADYHKYPDSFSGGALQLVNIARAMAVDPEIVISDEGISILDAADQAKILNLLKDLQEKFGLTYIIVTHDLSVVRHVCDRIAVMYVGKIVELGSNSQIYQSSRHPYTKALFDSIPTIADGPKGIRPATLRGEVPSPINLPAGCVFYPRCPIGTDVCGVSDPELREIEPGHSTACHHWKKLQ